MATKKRLGRNLGGLISDNSLRNLQTQAQTDDSQSELRKLPVDIIQRGKYQPRRDMHPESLEELADSIRQQGILQPIVVRKLGDAGKYEIIAGERRWRAAQLAGLELVPALVRDVPDEDAIVMALIENIQRENLNPIEEAHALERLIRDFGLTHQQAAEAVSRSRAAVTNLLRLLALNDDVKKMMEKGDLEMGHGRALLGLPATEQSHAAHIVMTRGLSVRETEQLVRKLQTPASSKKSSASASEDPDIRRLENDLAEKLGARVTFKHNAKGKGSVVIHYNSLDELDGILRHIK